MGWDRDLFVSVIQGGLLVQYSYLQWAPAAIPREIGLRYGLGTSHIVKDNRPWRRLGRRGAQNQPEQRTRKTTVQIEAGSAACAQSRSVSRVESEEEEIIKRNLLS